MNLYADVDVVGTLRAGRNMVDAMADSIVHFTDMV